MMVFRLGSICAAILLLASCESRQRRAMAELSSIGVEVSGLSLTRAVGDGDRTITALLLEAGVYTEQRDPEGRTPLALASGNLDYPSVWMLLNAGANVNATLANQASVLGTAAELGDSQMFDTLLAAGASPDGLMPDGEKILPWAIRSGNLALARKMLKSGSDPHLSDRAGSPILHLAMEAGHRDITESLLKLGADPGALTRSGASTLHLALRRDWDDMLVSLAHGGADPNGRTTDGLTLLQDATLRQQDQRVVHLLKAGSTPDFPSSALSEPSAAATVSPLRHAFDAPDCRLFRLFLAHGAQPANGDWAPWLRDALTKRDLGKIRLLLSHGIREPRAEASGLRIVEAAVLAGDTTLAKLLCDYGFDPGKALQIASKRGDHGMAGLLLACGANPDITLLPSFETPLASAIRKRHDKVGALLIRHGAATRLRLPEGQSAFHLAAATGCHRTLKELLDAGADPNEGFASPASPAFIRLLRPGVMRWVFRNQQNPTPLMVAADSGVTHSARHLLRAGAKTNVRTRSSSLWPINFASRRADIPMMRLFLGQDPYREERFIEVRLSEQRARMYDADGNEILNTRISTGRKGYATPTGEFVITNKYRHWTSTIYHASMPYFQRLNCGDFGFHQGVVPNYPASHGCIRVPTGTAAKLFSITQTGDRVTILP